MCEINCLLERDQLTDTGIICKLSKRQTITIPKKVRERLFILAGDEVTISMIAKSNELIIQKTAGNTLENKMIINEKGAIRIPIELGRFLSLKKGDSFLLYLTDHDPFILLKKLN